MHESGPAGFLRFTSQSVKALALLRVFCPLLICFFLSGTALQAQPAPPSPKEKASQPNQSPDITNQEHPTGKTDTREFHLSRERYEKAVAYSRAGYTLYFVSAVWGIVALWLLLAIGTIETIRNFAEGCTARRILQGVIFVPLVVVILGVAQLPIELYWHSLSLKYEQSVQRYPSWMWDWAKGEMISIVFGLVAAMILMAVIRKSPRRWWLYFWLASIPLVVFVVMIAPWVLDPLFHKFVPLQQNHPQLVSNIEKLTQRAGEPIPRDRMFLMMASEKSNQINAYVAGLGASKRVVVWDNTIQKMTPDEVLAVVGHEMGHYVLGHVTKGMVFSIAGILVALFLAYHLLQGVLRRWGTAWGVRGQADWAALPVLLLIGSVLGFLGEPVGNAFSRSMEHAADVYGLEVTHGILPDAQEAAAHSFQVMGELDLADPDPPPIITLWLYSHPPLADRLKFARDYDPWDEGKPTKYVK